MSRHVYSWYYNYVLSYMPFLCVAQPPTRSDLIGIMIGIMIINDYQWLSMIINFINDISGLSWMYHSYHSDLKKKKKTSHGRPNQVYDPPL